MSDGNEIENLGAPLKRVPREITVPHRAEAKQIIEELAQTLGLEPQELFNFDTTQDSSLFSSETHGLLKNYQFKL